jgi:hypothetical protein
VQPAEVKGEFDIEINIVDEYENDILKDQRIYEAISLLASNPQLMQYVDLSQLVVEWMRRMGIDPSKIVVQPGDFDASEIARQENRDMSAGQPATVKPGENLRIHLAEHEGERLRYKGIEDEFPGVASLLDQHITETKQAINTAPKPGGSAPAPSRAGNAGQASQQMLGAAFGG